MDDRSHIAFLLHDVSRLFRSRFDARARELGVTRQQWRVLFNLARNGGRTQAELADLLEVERITLCRMIDRLEEAKLVERRADPRDRRVWRLHLLPAAEAIVGQLAVIGAALEDAVMAEFSSDEREALSAMLVRIRDGLRALDADRPRAVA